MSDIASDERWKGAVGVIPLETVLAQEHDRLHGDTVALRIRDLDVAFTPDQFLDPAAFAHRLLRAWSTLGGAGARASKAVDTTSYFSLVADEPPLDAATLYILSAVDDARRPAVYAALQTCAVARERADTDRLDADAVASLIPVADADAALVRVMVPLLNSLLDERLDRHPAFAPFIEQGDVDALGERADQTFRRVNRMLLEAAFGEQIRHMRDIRLGMVYEAVRQRDTAALCLSGGGIRSATFALGVLRGLASHGLLGRFDYLSTVSGGGYAGSWLSAWMYHAGAAKVQMELARSSRETLDPEPAPVQHLRAYSHFLAPRVGSFSIDAWTLMATISRNMLLNWMVLIPLMAAALLVPRFTVSVIRVHYHDIPAPFRALAGPTLIVLLLVGMALGIVAASFVHRNRPGNDDDVIDAATSAPGEVPERFGTQRDFVRWCFAPLLAASALLTTGLFLWWDWGYQHPALLGAFGIMRLRPIESQLEQSTSVVRALKHHPEMVLGFIVAGALVHGGGWLVSGRLRRHPREALPILFSGVVAGLVGLVVGMWFLTRPQAPGRELLYATLAPPAFLCVMLIGSQLFTGWTSRSTGDEQREWIARFSAWLLMAIVAWTCICTLVLYGPSLISSAWRQLTVFVVGGGSGVAGVLLARSAGSTRTHGSPTIGQFVTRLAMFLAAPAFLVCIVIALAAFNERLISAACEIPRVQGVIQCRPRPRLDDLSSFVILVHRLADRVDTLSTQFGSTGADDGVVRSITRGDSAMRRAGSGLGSPAIRDSMLGAITSDASAALDRTRRADSVLDAHSGEFTAGVVTMDTAAVKSIDNDAAFRDLLGRRSAAELRVDRALQARRLHRDSAAALMDATLLDMERRVGSARATLAPAGAVDSLHALIEQRLRRSIQVFERVKRDSLTRAMSRDWVESERLKAGLRQPYDGAVPLTVIALLVLLAGFGMLMGWRIDTNKFSLRAMYEMRLVRAYLGASRPDEDRRPNPFTGFDGRDDIAMGRLWPAWGPTAAGAGRLPTSPPLHVVNVTLNLVAGSNLAWQQRMAESMTISPLHAGSAFVGYRPTTASTAPAPVDGTSPKLYGGDNGISLGTAVTISGAAAASNSGSHSSPVITFLMTFFNARLGAWLGNPGRAGENTFHLGAPDQNITPILSEMFGLTTDQSRYVYLSDGGHFENLGLYEMVLRRCRFILVSDAGCDPTATFDDLGIAVRKIRVDFGVPVEFPHGVQIYSRGQSNAEENGTYWAVGRIRYSAVDNAPPDEADGVLIYVKPAIYGREPSDVQQYAKSSNTFPHESTSDQFFSESQFESYRALGEFIVRQLLAEPLTQPLCNVASKRQDSLLSQWSHLGASDSSSATLSTVPAPPAP